MSKTVIPSADFNPELVGGSVVTAAKAAGAGKAEMWSVAVDKILPIDGFNVRVDTPAYIEHIESIAKSMVSEGYYPNKPVGGYVAKTDDGHAIMLTDGYSRLRAVARANELLKESGSDVQIEAIPVVVKPQASTIEDLTVALVQDNNGRPLEPYEKAIVVKRLESYGVGDEDIARRLGFTPRYVLDLKVLAGAPTKVRNMVIQGKVSATEAVKELRKNGEKAAARLEAGVKAAAEAGKAKATGKDIRKAAAAEPAAGDTEKESGVTMKGGVKDGKLIERHVFRFKQGDIRGVDDIRLVSKFRDGAWWDFVDEETDKEHVVIEEDVLIEVIVTVKEPEDSENASAADETFDPVSDDDAVENGDAVETPPAADETGL